MYAVEALIPDLAWTVGGRTWPQDKWTEVHPVPQLETDQEELQEARRVAEQARRFYVSVRITASAGGEGLRRVVA